MPHMLVEFAGEASPKLPLPAPILTSLKSPPDSPCPTASRLNSW